MKKDALKQFTALRDALVREKARLESRLNAVNAALGSGQVISRQSAPAKVQVMTRKRKRPNALSLRDALLKVTSAKPLTKQEILDALEQIGYVTSSKNPKNLLNQYLYGKRAVLQSVGGKFRPR